MTKEQIEKASMEYAVGNSWYPGETSYESDIKAMEESFADAFKAGAQWRINSVWHDAEEEPKQNAWFIAQGEDDEIYFDTFILRQEEYDNWQNW